MPLQSKIFIENKGEIAEFSAHHKVPFSDCRTGRIHEIDVSTRVRVYGQEHELLTLARPVRGSVPDRTMDKQMWDSRLPMDDEAEHSIDFKQRKCEFPITGKVRAANCW